MPSELPTDFTLIDDPLPYVAALELRPLSQIDLVVIHCTELPTLADARQFGERVLYPSGTGNSGHYYIDRDGRVLAYVPVDRIAHHVRGYNPRAVGIELVNTGRYPHWLARDSQRMDEPYTPEQIATLGALLASLQRELPELKYIAGHEDLDTTHEPASDDASVQVARKMDPGPLFPWSQVMQATALERLQP
ncbi:N-acetylmuramoyl-L-alanine amidase [Pseudoxanthomonas sp. SL93]|uniref:N-acetylmuramoyl-L-alanine amidase n=1 Tax=Pseudoxanthomonas sp. SL93 TaxID=2995142 RepID=UPI00226FAF3C|nr:N-acetylmuramoyl-L-alanine amidase [Pseudoxanthomonas sp. SL93]WAC64568.1 N-acetylmuramoyl-L-alanine amidase [Pseudoxanthomonas sp. SL93]